MEGKMELERIPDYPERNGGVTREEVIDHVRVSLIRYLERHRDVSTQDIADACGHRRKTIAHFISRKRPSLVLAQAIVLEYPEIGAGLDCVCPHCGRVPHFSQHR